jgi:hypothetical protein
MPSLNSGGVMRKSRNIYTGRRGGKCVFQRVMEVWVLEICIALIWLC